MNVPANTFGYNQKVTLTVTSTNAVSSGKSEIKFTTNALPILTSVQLEPNLSGMNNEMLQMQYDFL